MSDYDIIIYIQPSLMDKIRGLIGGQINIDDLYQYVRTKTATHCFAKILGNPTLNIFDKFYFWWNAKMNSTKLTHQGLWFSGALALRKERDGMYVGYLFGNEEQAFAFGPAREFGTHERRAESCVTANFGAHKLLDELMYGKVPNHPIYSIDIHMENSRMILEEGQLELVS